MAGLVCYYNYDNNYYLNMSLDDEGKNLCDVKMFLLIRKSPRAKRFICKKMEKPVYLKAEVRECDVTFFVSQDGISYTQVGEMCFDMRNLSDERRWKWKWFSVRCHGGRTGWIIRYLNPDTIATEAFTEGISSTASVVITTSASTATAVVPAIASIIPTIITSKPTHRSTLLFVVELLTIC